jgi:WhiB family redox-sensing transcriptional regulator
LFFGSERERAVDREFREAKAVAICQACPVVAACRDWALANPSWADAGVWGATTESERASTRRRQQRDRLRAAGGAS